MNTTLTAQEIITELKTIPGIWVGNPIYESIFKKEVIGVTVEAPSEIRKQTQTLPMMENWCRNRGFTLTDKYPCSRTMQIYF